MSFLDELASTTGDKGSNDELVKRCLETPALLHTVAEGLRTGTPKAKVDCAQIFLDVAKRRAELLHFFVGDLFDAARAAQEKGGTKRVIKIALTTLTTIADIVPAEVFAERDYLLAVANEGGAAGLEAVAILSRLGRDNANYRGKLLGPLLRLLNNTSDDDFSRMVAAMGPAVEGSVDGIKRLQQAVAARRDTLTETARQRCDRTLVKLERTTVRTKKKAGRAQ